MLESPGILSCVAQKGPCCHCLIPCLAFALTSWSLPPSLVASGGHCVLFPSTQLPLWVFQDGFRKPCKFDQVPSTDHALLHFLPFAWEPLGKLLIWLVPGASEYITALQRGAWVGDVVGDMSKASTWPGLPLMALPTPQFEMLNAELEENQELANSRMAELEKLQAELQGAVRTNERLKVSCVGGWEGLSLRSRG